MAPEARRDWRLALRAGARLSLHNHPLDLERPDPFG